MAKRRGLFDGYPTYDTSEGFGNPEEWRRAFNERMGMDEARGALGSDSPRAILGVGENATKSEIKRAFRELARQWHPDVNAGQYAEAEAKMKRLNAAYLLLREEFGKSSN